MMRFSSIKLKYPSPTPLLPIPPPFPDNEMFYGSRSSLHQVHYLHGLRLLLRGVGGQVPHLNAVDLEGAVVSPSGPPLSLVIIELGRGPLGDIRPRLGSNSVLEVPSSSSDSQVEDQIERPIEGGVFVLGVLPGVVPVVDAGLVPIALLGVVHLQHAVGISVQVGVDLLVVPVEAVGVEVVGEGTSRCALLGVGLGVLVGEEISAPMHGGTEGLGSSSELTRVANVSSALHDVDLTAGGPLSVLVVPGQRPDGGPEPVSLGQFGLDLHSAVLEGEGVDGGQLSAHHGVDVVVSIAGPAAPVEEGASALVGRRSSPELVGVAGSHELGSDLVLSQDGLDVEHSVLDESSGPVVVIELELPVTSSGKGDVVPPGIKVEEVEVVLEDELAARQEEQGEKEQDGFHLNFPSGYDQYNYKSPQSLTIKATVEGLKYD